jgi:hypothetical protein
MNDMNPHCDLIDTNTYFNNKKVYQCNYCNIKIGLDSADTKMICFKKMQDFSLSIRKATDPNYKEHRITMVDDPSNMQNLVLERVIERSKEIAEEKNETIIDNSEKNMCSQEEISARLTICESCEHYQDNSCLLCGCRIVREVNHMNKLAHKDQSCPANKWGPILSIID